MDVGGFLGEPVDDLLIRWLQAGLFLSHNRIHGFGSSTTAAPPPTWRGICCTCASS